MKIEKIYAKRLEDLTYEDVESVIFNDLRNLLNNNLLKNHTDLIEDMEDCVKLTLKKLNMKEHKVKIHNCPHDDTYNTICDKCWAKRDIYLNIDPIK